MSETKLKPCPFCGRDGEAFLDHRGDLLLFYFVLCSCGARGPDYSNERGAKLLWNRRAKEEK